MNPTDDVSQDVRIRGENTGETQVIKVVVPRVKMHSGQLTAIIGSILGGAAIIAALLAAFFVSKTEATVAHAATNLEVGKHIVADDQRDAAVATEQAEARRERKAVQHNLVQIGARVHARDMKTAADFDTP